MRIRKFFDGLLVEAIDLEQHFPVADTKKIFALGEEEVEGAAVELHISGYVLHGKRHLRGFGFDFELFEKLSEVRVCDFVVNHEAGI